LGLGIVFSHFSSVVFPSADDEPDRKSWQDLKSNDESEFTDPFGSDKTDALDPNSPSTAFGACTFRVP
jgi:hypothetical protein